MVVIGDGFASVCPVDGLPVLALAAYEVDLADAIESEKLKENLGVSYTEMGRNDLRKEMWRVGMRSSSSIMEIE